MRWPRGWLHLAATLGPPDSDGKGTVTLYQKRRRFDQRTDVAAEGRRALAVLHRQERLDRRHAVQRPHVRGAHLDPCPQPGRAAGTMNKPLVGNEPGLCVYRSLVQSQTATIQGAVQRVLADLPTTTSGVLGFDGIDDAVKLPTLNVDLSRGFSLEFWLYLDSLPAADTAIVELGTTSGASRITLRHRASTGNLSLTVWDTATNGMSLLMPNLLKAGQWMHIAVTQEAGTYNSGLVWFYVNGELRGSNALRIPANVLRDNCWIGRASYGSPGGCATGWPICASMPSIARRPRFRAG